ncbi:hypothetical protein V8F33_001729 [Rhypophila sp. PSN 637]
MFGSTRTTHTTTAVAPRRRGLFSRRRAPVTHTVPVHTTHHRKKRAGAGLFSRRAPRAAHHAHTTVTPVVHHHKRKPSMSDKISGALLKLKGTLTGRPGQKAAGTRRMHGTDGRGSRRRW